MFDFVGKKKLFFGISIGVILFGLVANILFGTKLDVSFKGGTLISYSFSGNATVSTNKLEDVVRGVINSELTVTKGSNIKESADEEDVSSINITIADKISEEQRDGITAALKEKLNEDVTMLSFYTVPATVGRSLFGKGFATILISSLLMVVYLAFRFRNIGGFSAGCMALVALIQDMFIAYFAFVVFRIPLDDNFIAVILTIIGYSLNDTIVIYDRIRENRSLFGNSKPLEEIVNLSLNQTFRRSLVISVATFIAVLTITIVAYIANIPSILSFSLPMCVGVITGCYSSIFVATPLWVVWKNGSKNSKKKAKA